MEPCDKLSGADHNRLKEALLSAFPARSALAQMVRAGLDENLDGIVAQENLQTAVFELIQWAEAHSKLDKLIAAARAANPDNPVLRGVAEELVVQNGRTGPATEGPRRKSSRPPRAKQSWRDSVHTYGPAWRGSVAFVVFIAIVTLTIHVVYSHQWPNAGLVEPWRDARIASDLVQTLALLWLIEVAVRDHESDDDEERGKEFVEPFRLWWSRLWGTWFLFYAFHTATELFARSTLKNCEKKLLAGCKEPGIQWLPWINVGNDTLHNVQSMTFFVLFWMLFRPTLDKDHPSFRLKNTRAVSGAIYCLVFAVMEAVIVSWSSADLADPKNGLVTASFIIALLVGTAGASFMGMFIGRLESAYLDVHVYELAILYLYAAVQPFYPLLRVVPDRHDVPWLVGLDLFLKMLAGALKFGLYFVVHRQLKTGRLAFHVKQLQDLRERVDNDFDDWKKRRRG
jgi:hypothetical protein